MELVPEQVPNFTKANLETFPSIAALQEDALRCIWVLWVAKDTLDHPWLTAAQVSDALRDVFGVFITRQRVAPILVRASGARYVASKTVHGRRHYRVMEEGIAAVRSVEGSVLFITPEKSLTSIRAVEELLRSLRGDIRVCDPYVDGRTLDWLGSCANASFIRLLTVNVKNSATTFLRDLAAFHRQYKQLLEVRVLTRGVLHDRYVVDDGRLLLFGTSLNGLGAKQTFVVDAGENLRATVISAFDDAWSKASQV